MSSAQRASSSGKENLHPRNRHRAPYDFRQLAACCPALAPFVRLNRYGGESIDFADPAAVKTLNQALLKHFYGVASWDIPPGYLCPPIPGRADYVHHVADLLASERNGTIPRGATVSVLDVGVGANCVYPIIGSHEYGWRFVGTETNLVALRNAQQVVAANPSLARLVECRHQPSSDAIFRNVIKPGECFDATLCNPPFHASPEDAAAGTQRKLKNLSGKNLTSPILNFGGQATELWCEGGELSFIRRMIAESAQFAEQCRWFTTLVSKSEHLPSIYRALKAVNAADVKTIAMAQGQKKTRVVAWMFRLSCRPL